MRRILGIAAAWTAATLVAVVIAAAAVASVRTEVTDAPTALGAPAVATEVTAQAQEPVDQSTSTTAAPVDTTTTTVNLEDAIETTTTTPQVASSTSTTTTKAPAVASTSTTTTTTDASYTKTYDTEAGSVRIVVSGDSVSFAGATPLPGWTVELENSGPEEVKVHFERNDDEKEEIEFKAKIDDGELKVSTSESEDD
jgi:hypothetical protein